jgi:hypothetical protein
VTPEQAGGQPVAGLPEGIDGRLYVEAAGGGDFGYANTDEGDVLLWQGFLAFGGPGRLGYPVTQSFELDGRTAQLTQRALLQWDPQAGRVTLGNVFELFPRAGALLGWPGCTGSPEAPDGAAGSDCGLEGWLEQRGVPPAAADRDPGDTDGDVIAARLGWLEHAAIRAAFLGDSVSDPAAAFPAAVPEAGATGAEAEDAATEEGDSATGALPAWSGPVPWAAIERFGLPMSRPQRYGPFIAQRFQRATLQLWLDELEGLPPPGTVTQVMGGELLRDAGFAPAESVVPVDGAGTPGEPPALPPPPAPPAAPVPEGPTPEAMPAPTPVSTPIATPTVRSFPTAVSAQPTPSPASAQPTPSPASVQASPTASQRWTWGGQYR